MRSATTSVWTTTKCPINVMAAVNQEPPLALNRHDRSALCDAGPSGRMVSKERGELPYTATGGPH